MWKLTGIFIVVFVIVGCGKNAINSKEELSKDTSQNSPQDKPVSVINRNEKEEFRKAVAPYIEKARKTYPDAKERYLKGLPKGYKFFVVKKLQDNNVEENVFILVEGINKGYISGRIANDVLQVSGYKMGDLHNFPEQEIIDWLITLPDGTEEGNIVGNFLDEWQKTRSHK